VRGVCADVQFATVTTLLIVAQLCVIVLAAVYHTRVSHLSQGRLNHWAHWARAQGPQIFSF